MKAHLKSCSTLCTPCHIDRFIFIFTQHCSRIRNILLASICQCVPHTVQSTWCLAAFNHLHKYVAEVHRLFPSYAFDVRARSVVIHMKMTRYQLRPGAAKTSIRSVKWCREHNCCLLQQNYERAKTNVWPEIRIKIFLDEIPRAIKSILMFHIARE